ncbi:hypothetical protein AAHB54_04100 [Bacillus cereus]
MQRCFFFTPTLTLPSKATTASKKVTLQSTNYNTIITAATTPTLAGGGGGGGKTLSPQRYNAIKTRQGNAQQQQ